MVPSVVRVSSTVSSTLLSAIRCPPLRRYVRVLGEEDKGMDRCNELCTKDVTGTCTVCEALAERDRFLRFWFQGGLFVDGVHAMQRRGVFALLHRYAFPICFLVLGGLLHLWFAWRATGPYFV